MVSNEMNDIKYHRGKDNTYNTKGSNSRNAKLTEEVVYKIKFERNDFTRNEIAEEFGINKSHVSHIRNGRSWRHVKQ